MFTKGQASTEYMVVLAVVVVVGLVAVGVLSGFIQIGETGTDKAARAYWKTAEVGVSDWLIQTAGEDYFAVKNNQAETITITAAKVGGITLMGTPVTLRPGESARLNGEVGQGGKVELNYTTSRGLNKAFTGEKPITASAARAGTTISTTSTSSTTTSSTVTTTIARTALSCTGSSTHYCDNYKSIQSIDGFYAPQTASCGGQAAVTVNWTGWHWNDDNYWGFFVDNSYTDSCSSYKLDTNPSLYTMSCTVDIGSGFMNGSHTLTVTGQDSGGYCNVGETGVDAQSSRSITLQDCALISTTTSTTSTTTTLGNLVQLDYVNIGNVTNETGHDILSWSDIWTWGGNYGGGDDGTLRTIIPRAPNCTSDDKEAFFAMTPTGTAKVLELRHLWGSQKDAYNLYIKESGTWTQITVDSSKDMVCSGTECWYTDVYLLGDRTGKMEFKLLYTANDIPSWCNSWGLNAFSWARLKG